MNSPQARPDGGHLDLANSSDARDLTRNTLFVDGGGHINDAVWVPEGASSTFLQRRTGIDNKLAGKVAVVAGGGGIGGATARLLAEEGATVVIGDLDADNAQGIAAGIVERGGQAKGIGCDISDATAVAALIKLAVDFTAGATLPMSTLRTCRSLSRDSNALEVDLDIFDRTIAVNLRGHCSAPERCFRNCSSGAGVPLSTLRPEQLSPVSRSGPVMRLPNPA